MGDAQLRQADRIMSLLGQVEKTYKIVENCERTFTAGVTGGGIEVYESSKTVPR